jgi:predicted metal-dependent hydrolase
MSFFRRLVRPSAAPLREERRRVALPPEEMPVDVLLRFHPRARRIKLQIDPMRGMPVLTLPPGAAEADGLAFLTRNAGWVRRALGDLPESLAFADGAVFPLLGRDTRIVHDASARAGVREAVNGGESIVIVSGGADHLPRRLTDHLKRRARAAIRPLALEKAAAVGRQPGRITIRDQRTRWGSCSASGDLSFSWRLILTPPEILDYVVAHEVAHLVHHDHSKDFWAVVATLHPDPAAARAWLGRHGARLHRIG